MSDSDLRILAVHGIGNHERSQDWQEGWHQALKGVFENVGRPFPLEDLDFTMHDHIFGQHNISWQGTLSALGKLGYSGLTSLFRQRRFIGGVQDWLYWYAGMVVLWVENEQVRRETRELLIADIQRFDPQVICGHSLGSLICYDTLTSDAGQGLMEGRTLITLGSQINHPFVAGQFLGGRVQPLEHGFWYHLYNRHDKVFTNEIHLRADNFRQVQTPFFKDPHGAVGYLEHENTVDHVWRNLAMPRQARSFTRAIAQDMPRREPRQRALLIGIDEYPDPRWRLDGCVNDVFQVSSVLQECEFEADEIRVVLNDRATKQGILDRIRWLLDDAGPDDRLVLAFSGHGAQLPVYDPSGHVSHKLECLAPYDFAWSQETAISDEDLFDLYSELDYQANFLIILDCCHSGGLTRDGVRMIRGISPPDDIRHRMLKWNSESQMWVPRQLEHLNEDLARDDDHGSDFMGRGGDTMRLGAAMPLRTLSQKDFNRVVEQRHHKGPFMPLILHACEEDEFAFEYRHGVISYGAFTFVLAKTLRAVYREQRSAISFEDLVERTRDELEELGYDQTPDLAGPTAVKAAAVPWGCLPAPPPPRRSRSRKRRQ